MLQINNEYILKRVAEMEPELEARSQADVELIETLKKRGGRNKVDPFALFRYSYDEYRKTDLWKAIKTRVLARDGYVCKRCGGGGRIPHHLSYEEAVMRGEDDSKLVTVCDGCHDIIHYHGNRNRRSDADARAALIDLTLNEPLPKVDLRKKVEHQLSARHTSAQREQFVAEYNEKKLARLARR